MFASHGHRRSPHASSRISPAAAAALLLAAWIASVALPAGAQAAGEAPAATTSRFQSPDYDPFELPAPAAVPAPLNRAAGVQQLGGYDPFDAFAPATAAATTTTAAETTCVFQENGPALSEPLPAPQGAYQPADDAAEPGAAWSPKPIRELSTNIVLPSGLLPRDNWTDRSPQPLAFFDPCGTTRGWPVNTFVWEASCFCHNPLYFEEINLERYGYGCCACLQPAVSACHFFATVPALPYKMSVDCPGECDYTLGHYRPGSCPPWQYHCCSRVSGLGALSTAGVATGIIFLIP